jgi:hypothetical protein
MKHKTKEGALIDLKDLEIGHLKNIIALIEKKAKAGITVMFYGGAIGDIEDSWSDEEVLKGKKALDHLRHAKYIKELKSRSV